MTHSAAKRYPAITLSALLGLGLGWMASLDPMMVAWAIPGQVTNEAVAWIQANPVLQPKPGETFLVQRVEPDGSRFSFQSSVIAPGRVIPPLDKETIRSERITLFDPNGLTAATLSQYVRDIYGPTLAADFDQSTEVLRYPRPEVFNQPPTEANYLERAIQGVVRQGQQLIYWLELTQNRDGTVQQGQIVVFQPEWLDKVTAELRERHNLP